MIFWESFKQKLGFVDNASTISLKNLYSEIQKWHFSSGEEGHNASKYYTYVLKEITSTNIIVAAFMEIPLHSGNPWCGLRYLSIPKKELGLKKNSYIPLD